MNEIERSMKIKSLENSLMRQLKQFEKTKDVKERKKLELIIQITKNHIAALKIEPEKVSEIDTTFRRGCREIK